MRIIFVKNGNEAIKWAALYNRVGGGLAPSVFPHHRTYGSVYGGSYIEDALAL